MSASNPHDPELIAVLTAAATAALGQNVRVTAVQPADPAEPKPSSGVTVNHMTPGITDLLPKQDATDPGKAKP